MSHFAYVNSTRTHEPYLTICKYDTIQAIDPCYGLLRAKIRNCWCSIVNEEILDEKLKPHFKGEANEQEGHCAWIIWYSSHDTSNLPPETHVLPQPLALATSRCEYLPCLCLPLFSRTVYLGNFYYVCLGIVSSIPEPVSNTGQNQAKTKYKELSYLNPIVPALIFEAYQMLKRMMGSSLLGPLSSMWFEWQLCSDSPKTLWPDILAKNCSGLVVYIRPGCNISYLRCLGAVWIGLPQTNRWMSATAHGQINLTYPMLSLVWAALDSGTSSQVKALQKAFSLVSTSGSLVLGYPLSWKHDGSVQCTGSRWTINTIRSA